MKRHSSAVTLALVVLAVLGLTDPVAAGEQVPFLGHLEGVFTVTPVDPPISLVLASGTGEATQIGEFTFVIPNYVNMLTNIGTGSYEFTAANGDTLFATSTAESSLTSNPNIRYVKETATITSGTGRFAGATGDFIGERFLDRFAGTTIGSFSGTISSPVPEPATVTLLALGLPFLLWRNARQFGSGGTRAAHGPMTVSVVPSWRRNTDPR